MHKEEVASEALLEYETNIFPKAPSIGPNCVMPIANQYLQQGLGLC